MISPDTLDALIARLEKAEGPDREIDILLTELLISPSEAELHRIYSLEAYRFTHSVDASLALAERVLPGWTWRVASCSVSDDAWVCPDFNHPELGKQFHEMFDGAFEGRDPAEAIYEATDVDQRPPGRPALALVKSTLRGLTILRALSNQSGGER